MAQKENLKGNGNISCIILAAGFGSRVKNLGIKPLLLYQNKPFIQTIAEKAIKANFSPVVCISNSDNFSKIKDLNLPVEVLLNSAPENGMFSSILIGIRFLAEISSNVLIMPVDYPLVKIETFKILQEEAKRSPNFIFIPSYQKKSGHPVMIPAVIFKQILKSSPKATLRDVFNSARQIIRYIDVNDPGILININTEEAYREYCQ
jgi:CTP:molybdopterin cytidylyltransferase MocA